MGSSRHFSRSSFFLSISDENDASIQAALLLLPGSREDLSLSLNETAVDKGESKKAREDVSIGSHESAVNNGQSMRGRKDLSVGLQEAAVDKGKSTRGRTSLCVASVFVIHYGMFVIVHSSSNQECFPGSYPDGDWFSYARHH